MAALACFFAWGLVPAYWKQIPYVTADEMVTHRVLWSLLFIGILLSGQRAWGGIRRQCSVRTFGWAALAGIAVTLNWWLFLWAVNSKLPEALEVMAAWGFEFKDSFVWVKDWIGQGVWARHRHGCGRSRW